MARQLIALPDQSIPARWDARRGVLRLGGNPEWERVRAAYDRQLALPKPIVDAVPKPWRDRRRRAWRALRWAAHVFLRGRP